MYEEHRAPRRLMRDPARRRIGGVCAGIARHYDLEPWIVRLAALTALIFFPSITFPAYWVAYFVMDRPARVTSPEPGSARDRAPRGDAPSTLIGPPRPSSAACARRATGCAMFALIWPRSSCACGGWRRT